MQKAFRATLLAAIVSAMTLTACGGPGAGVGTTPMAPAPAGAGASSSRGDAAASPGSATGTPLAARTVDITTTDQLRFLPDAVSVRAGETVVFTIRNTGSVDHEFTIGDEAEQQTHEQEMAAMGGMTMNEPNAVPVPAGKTTTLRYTFC